MGCRRPRTIAWAFCVWFVLAANASVAVAQERREPPPEAVEFYRTGREHFAAGRYREAIVDLERALTLDPGSPTLLYNLGRVHELLGDLPTAIEYYGSYVRLLPPTETEERARIEESIRRLEGAQAHVTPPAPHEGPPPELDDGSEPRWVTERGVVDAPFWIAAGTSAALLVGGGILGALALDRESRAQSFVVGSDGTLAERDAFADEADNLALGADVLLLGAVAAGITAGLLYGLRTRTVEHLPEHGAEPFIATDGSAAVVGLRGTL